MKQYQFGYSDDVSLIAQLEEINGERDPSVSTHIVFHIFTEDPDRELCENICRVINDTIPDSLYLGASTCGNIMNGDFSDQSVVIVCTVYEDPSTRIELMQLPFTDETNVAAAEALKKYTDENPWVRSVEMIVAGDTRDLKQFCSKLSEMRPNISFFGGSAFSYDMRSVPCVFSSAGDYSEENIVFMLSGGENYHIISTYVTGWKPLGKTFTITKVSGEVIYEIDGDRAYNVYNKYLNIGNNQYFFSNSLEFPLIFNRNGMNILCAPVACNEDGSLVMASDMSEGEKVRLSYGDPWMILNNARRSANEVFSFRPETIKLFSCASRRAFWGNDEIGKETRQFSTFSSAFGFYTSGEFLRTNGTVFQHNVTLIIAAEREGTPRSAGKRGFILEDWDYSGRMSMISRLANFIDAATQELREANQKLEAAAITDGLTGLLNRVEIQRRIRDAVAAADELSPITLIMLDIDDFKHVNDTYGHNEGDLVIKRLCGLIKNIAEENSPHIDAGRWGGEEFMLLVHSGCRTDRAELAENIRRCFADMVFDISGSHTVSIGVTDSVPGESTDSLCIRVDNALYRAKKTGKNRVCFGKTE